uniref:C2H2-type domain-containing protein n=1 Tax=Pyricularia oryzae (strain P131) TaxID=1143193 RepID=L7JMC7_PYRO1
MNQHGAADEQGERLSNLGSKMDMDMSNSMPSAGSADNLTQFPAFMYWCNNKDEPWSSLAAANVLSEPPLRLHSGTNPGRTPGIPRNAAELPSFMGYRLPQSAISECSTQPLVDRFTSDSGYGTVQSASRLSIANTSVFGDNNTDTQSLAGHLSNFELQANNPTPVEEFYNRSHEDLVSGATAYSSQPTMHGSSPLTCPHCPDPFKTKSQLKKHMQRHDKTHFCKVHGCSRKAGFSTQNDLDRHKRSKHPATHATGRRYRCHLGACKNKPKKWPRADNFRQHLKRRHRDEVEDDNLEQFVVNGNPPLANGVIERGSNVDTETEYLGLGPLHVELSDVGQNLRATEKPQQVRSAAAEDTRHAFVEDDFQQDMREQPQLFLEVPFDDAGMMLGRQFTEFSPTTPDSQDVSLHTIDNPPTVDFGFREPYIPPAATERSSLIVESQGALTSILYPYPEDLGFNSHDSFHNHGGLYQEFSDPPQITIDMVGPDNDDSSLLNYDEPHRRSTDTITDVYAHDDDDNTSADNSEISGDVDAPGEPETAQITGFSMGASSPQESEDESGGITRESSGAASPAETPLAVHVSQETEQEGRDEDEDSSQTTKTAFLEKLKAGGLDEILKQHGWGKLFQSQAAARRRSSSQTSGGPSTEVSGNVKCPETGCHKTFNRECDLRKHIKRHKKPYGCTFRYCTKKFGSKSDWKRHENSQHGHQDGWRCDVMVPFPEGVTTEDAVTTKQPCGKQCHRRETFKTHLQRDHGLIEDEATEKLEQCHYGKDCESRFWCGFCVAFVGVGGDGAKGISSRGGKKKAADDGWSRRYDHIDDHLFGRTLPKKTISEWRHEGIETVEGPEKKERERSKRRQKTTTTKEDRSPPTHWECCIGHEVDCQHYQCSYCEKFYVNVPN